MIKIKTEILGSKGEYGVHLVIGNCGLTTERIWDTKAEVKVFERILKRSLKRELKQLR